MGAHNDCVCGNLCGWFRLISSGRIPAVASVYEFRTAFEVYNLERTLRVLSSDRSDFSFPNKMVVRASSELKVFLAFLPNQHTNGYGNYRDAPV